MQDVLRSFGLRTVLDRASLSIAAGERVGVVGRNGSGKTTLGRILAGEDEPDAGVVTRARDTTLGYLPQVPHLDASATAHDVVVAGMKAWIEARRRHQVATAALDGASGDLADLLAEQADASAEIERLGGWHREHEASAILSAVGIADANATVGTLSGGEQRRVALARLLVSRPSVAVLDEPTNHLDVDTIEWLEKYLNSEFAGALLLITHDRYLLDRVVSRTVEIESGQVHSYVGGYEAYLEAKAQRSEYDRRTEANRQNYLRRELQWLRRQPKARTGKSRARVQRIESAVELGGPAEARSVALTATAARIGRTIVEADELRIELGGRCLVDGFTLRLGKGERLGIVGPNAVGKTTLLRTLVGELEPTRGSVRLGKNTRIGYLDQVRSGLDDSETVFDAVAAGRSHIDLGGKVIEVRVWLERFLFEGAGLRQRVGELSGGERARVALAKLLSEAANVLVLDEPTNDLDVETLAGLEELLLDYDGACLVVTHDRWFLDRVATAIVAFEGDGVVVRNEGGWQDYRARIAGVAEPKPARERTTSDQPRAAKRVRLTYAEKLELEKIEAKVETAEHAVAKLEAQLVDPQTYSEGPEAGRELAASLERAKAELEATFARWQELESKRDSS